MRKWTLTRYSSAVSGIWNWGLLFAVDQWELYLISPLGFTFQGITINNCQVCESEPPAP
jgi:hypothetical protein